jgi:hypothetical protein
MIADPLRLGGYGVALLLLLLAWQPAAAQDPRAWTLWRVHYWQKLVEGDSSVTLLETKSVASSLMRVECEIIKQGKVADERAASHKQPFPDGASMMDVPNKRNLVTRFVCSREKPRVP